MSNQRINTEAIQAVKDWMARCRNELIENGINRIDAHYSDEDADLEVVDEIYAYWQEGSVINPRTYVPSPHLWKLLEALTTEDNFFQGPQGNGGEFRLLLETCSIEHSSYEYVTTKLDHEIEVY